MRLFYCGVVLKDLLQAWDEMESGDDPMKKLKAWGQLETR